MSPNPNQPKAPTLPGPFCMPRTVYRVQAVDVVFVALGGSELLESHAIPDAYSSLAFLGWFALTAAAVFLFNSRCYRALSPQPGYRRELIGDLVVLALLFGVLIPAI